MRVRDPDIVAAIVAGDPAGLTAAYENYAPALYTYCRSLLRDADDAADALHDTFIVASQKLDGLRDPERLRPWLYAVARNECLRLLKARRRTVTLEDNYEVDDESADVTVGVRAEELRDLVRAALDGLNPGDREILDLSMRHELNGAELGAALGVSANHAHALLSRARGQVEVALGALLVARAGSEDCTVLAELLRDWDGHFNTLIRKRVNRHIEGCEVCRERRGVELQPAMLLGLGPILLLPPEVRARILRLCAHVATPAGGGQPGETAPDGGGQPAGSTPEAAAEHAEISKIAHRAEPFDLVTGFPVPLGRRRGAPVRRRATLSTAVALLLLLMFATGASAALHLGPFRRTADHAADVRIVAVPAPTLVVSITSITASAPSLTPSSASPSPSPSPSTTSATPPAYVVITPVSTAPTTTQPHSPTPSPTPPPKQSPSPSPTPTPTPTPSVSVSGNPLELTARRVGAFGITAEGGTVNYTITLPSPASMYGDPLLSTMSGTLTDGQSVQVGVRIEDAESATTFTFALTVNPGDIQVQVTWPAP